MVGAPDTSFSNKHSKLKKFQRRLHCTINSVLKLLAKERKLERMAGLVRIKEGRALKK